MVNRAGQFRGQGWVMLSLLAGMAIGCSPLTGGGSPISNNCSGVIADAYPTGQQKLVSGHDIAQSFLIQGASQLVSPSVALKLQVIANPAGTIDNDTLTVTIESDSVVYNSNSTPTPSQPSGNALGTGRLSTSIVLSTAPQFYTIPLNATMTPNRIYWVHASVLSNNPTYLVWNSAPTVQLLNQFASSFNGTSWTGIPGPLNMDFLLGC